MKIKGRKTFIAKPSARPETFTVGLREIYLYNDYDIKVVIN